MLKITKIKKELHKHNITKIKSASKNEWKIWCNTCYFQGVYKHDTNRTKVFIKVIGPTLYDCFENEIKVNSYIDDHSEFLSNRKPKIYFNLKVDKFYILVFDYANIEPIKDEARTSRAIQTALNEYSKIGILHTDFGLVNIGIYKNDFYFFDYGTSLCPNSDKIRVRNSESYNHLSEITPQAKALLDAPDFYYDDAVHCGIRGLDRNNINFLVGAGDLFFAKLGNNIYQYRAQKRNNKSAILLLHRI